MEIQLARPALNAARDAWLTVPLRDDVTELGLREGPKRTKTQHLAAQNSWQAGHSDRAADVLGVWAEAYTALALGFDPFAIQYHFPTGAPSASDADIAGIYEVKRTNSNYGDLKYRVKSNANHVLVQVWIDRDYDPATDELTLKAVHLLGWNYPPVDGQWSTFHAYDTRNEPVRAIPIHRRRPMADIPLLGRDAA